jgi:hypothetical protein
VRKRGRLYIACAALGTTAALIIIFVAFFTGVENSLVLQRIQRGLLTSSLSSEDKFTHP